MSGRVRQAEKSIIDVYQALRDTRDGGYNCVSVGFTPKFIGCSCGVPCLHAPEVHYRSDSCSGLGRDYCRCGLNLRGGTSTYHGSSRSGFARQDCEASKSVVVAPMSGGGNMRM